VKGLGGMTVCGCGRRAAQIALIDANLLWLEGCIAAAQSENPNGWCSVLKQCPVELRTIVTHVIANYVATLKIYDKTK